MNAYLVVMRHDMDDLPLLLTNSVSEAMEFAKNVDEFDGLAEQKVLQLALTRRAYGKRKLKPKHSWPSTPTSPPSNQTPMFRFLVSVT